MSYILDALTKAAKQRDRQAPVLQRLLAPAPMARSMWTRPSGRLIVALVLNAGLLAMLLVMWLRSVPGVAPPGPVAGPPTEVLEKKTAQAELEKPPLLKPDKVPTITPQPPASPPAPRRATSTARRAPEPAVTPPAAPAAPPAPAETAGLRLEALIYSDAPARRVIFVNGHKYVEGDLLEGRLRVEEIQEDRVVLSGEGRRFTLRAAR